MNKRIKRLYKQSFVKVEKQIPKGGWDNDREPLEYKTVTETEFDPEKFAELILEEVMQELFINGYEDAFDHLNKHFGVEE